MGSAVLGSIEYPVTVLNVPLIVVLGHDSRGAVKATLSALDNGVAVVKVIPLGELNATHRLCDHVPMPRQTRPPLRLVLDQMRSPACTELLPPNDCAGSRSELSPVSSTATSLSR
jgi:hypothetical protein